MALVSTRGGAPVRLPNLPWPACRTLTALAANLAALTAALVVATLVALAACTSPLAYAAAWDVRGSVRFTSETADTVVARIVMINRVPKTLTAQTSAYCPPMVDVHVFHTGHPGGAAVWAFRQHGGGWACLAWTPPPIDVPPGDSVVYEVDFAVADVLGDSLAPGPWAFRGVMVGMGALDDGSYRTVQLGTLTLGLQPADVDRKR